MIRDDLDYTDAFQGADRPRKRRRLRFRGRVLVRILLLAPIILGILAGPSWIYRYAIAAAFLINFLSAEILFSKLRK